MSRHVHNPKRYREMSVPFPSAEEANAAIAAFEADVEAARIKHRIADVVVTACVAVDYESGEANAIGIISFGSQEQIALMAAYTAGHCAAEQAELRNSAMMKGRRAGGQKKMDFAE